MQLPLTRKNLSFLRSGHYPQRDWDLPMGAMISIRTPIRERQHTQRVSTIHIWSSLCERRFSQSFELAVANLTGRCACVPLGADSASGV